MPRQHDALSPPEELEELEELEDTPPLEDVCPPLDDPPLDDDDDDWPPLLDDVPEEPSLLQAERTKASAENASKARQFDVESMTSPKTLLSCSRKEDARQRTL